MLQLPSSRATTFVASLLALSAGPVFSAGAPDAIRRSLQQNYPQVRVIAVLPSPIDGLFEVFTGDSIAYTDASGRFLIVGQMMDTTSKKNLTSERIDDLNRVDLKRLPLDRSIRFVKGDGSRGAGLGLAIARSVVERHGGRLRHEVQADTEATCLVMWWPRPALPP